MRKVHGNGLPVECVNPQMNTYIVRWDIKPYYRKVGDTGEERPIGYEYYEKWFYHIPTMSEIKSVVLSWMNETIDQRIVSGFSWNGMSVWLSSENQFNYKAAYDLAVQTGGANLPVVFKFGTTEEPVYYQFQSTEELMGFYIEAMKYIDTTLNEGWREKDSVDWSVYESLLPKEDEIEEDEIES